MRLILRKPDRLELGNVNVLKERWGKKHELLMLSEEGGVVVDLERGRWELTKERVNRREILRRMKIMPNMPERPLCASIPPERGCWPSDDREPLGNDVLEAIASTERWWADVQDYLSAALFEVEGGYILIVSINTEEQKSRRVDFVEAERLVGVSVLGEIHSYDPIRGTIVRLPDMKTLADIGTVSGEPLAFTDDEDEAIVVTDEGIRGAKVRFRISETHHERSEGAAFIIFLLFYLEAYMGSDDDGVPPI